MSERKKENAEIHRTGHCQSSDEAELQKEMERKLRESRRKPENLHHQQTSEMNTTLKSRERGRQRQKEIEKEINSSDQCQSLLHCIHPPTNTLHLPHHPLLFLILLLVLIVVVCLHLRLFIILHPLHRHLLSRRCLLYSSLLHHSLLLLHRSPFLLHHPTFILITLIIYICIFFSCFFSSITSSAAASSFHCHHFSLCFLESPICETQSNKSQTSYLKTDRQRRGRRGLLYSRSNSPHHSPSSLPSPVHSPTHTRNPTHKT